MKRLALLGLLTASSLLIGCSDADYEDEQLGRGESWIINGQIDTEHDAVVALFTQNSGCTGTIIHVANGAAFVVTAAHCFANGKIQVVVIGDDYQSASAKGLTVTASLVHPQYSAQNLTYDFAMIRAAGAGSTTPVIPALTAKEDNMSSGTTIEHVGYGLTSYPNGQTTQRHHATGKIAQASFLQIQYNQPVSGPCSGDSGGPNLTVIAAGERVAGVISYGDQQCAQSGVSGRVSAVYESFILPFIENNGGGATTSSTSSSAATSGVGGGGSTSGAGGQGAGTADDGNWVAGDTPNKKYHGEILLSSCSIAAPASPSERGWSWLVGVLVLVGCSAGRFGTGRFGTGRFRTGRFRTGRSGRRRS